MNTNSFITVSCISFLLVGVSSQARANDIDIDRNIAQQQLIVQSDSQDDSVTIKSQAEKITNLFFAQQYDSFSDFVVPQLKASVAPDKMQTAWQETKENNGAFIKIRETEVIKTPASDLVTVTIEFEKATEEWIFVFNDDKKIIGINSPLNKSVEKIADDFISAVISGNYTRARSFFHPFLKETIFPEQIESSWNKLISEYGKFERIIDSDIKRGSNINPTDIVLVDIEFGKRNKEIVLIFDSSKNIIGVDFVEQ